MAIKKFNAIAGISVGDVIIHEVIDDSANVAANNLTVSNIADLGDVGNVRVSGGTAGFVLQTDGQGHLSWTNPADVGVVGFDTYVQFNDMGLFGADASFTFDKNSGLLSAPYFNGTLTTHAQANITSVGTLDSLTVDGLVTLTTVDNLILPGGTNGYVLTTNGQGQVSWQPATGGTITESGFIGINKDRFTADGTQTTFNLTTDPGSEDNITVNIDGLIQQSTVYSVSNGALVFPTAPEAGQHIEVTIYHTTAGTSDPASIPATEVMYGSGSGFASDATFTFNPDTTTLSAPNVNVTNGYLTVGSSPIAVVNGTAGAFNTGVTNVNLGLGSNVTIGSTSGNVTVRGVLQSNRIASSNQTISVDGLAVLDSFPATDFRSAKYIIRASSDFGYQTIEVLMVHDDVDAFITIYGDISTSDMDVVEITAEISAGNVELYATSIAANTTVKIMGTYLAD
jgi:hypothetical protein